MAESFEIADLRVPEGLALYIRANPSNWLFRVAPVRDPDQPRLWCLFVEQCSRIGVTGGTFEQHVSMRGMSRQELLDTLTEIRSAPESWLSGTDQRELSSWLHQACGAPRPGDDQFTRRGETVDASLASKEEQVAKETAV
jgi:hypothetical protein